MSELTVNLKREEYSYKIQIKNDELTELYKDILNIVEDKNYIVVFSKKVYNLYSKLIPFPKDKIFVLNDGEKEKNIQNFSRILNFALSKKLNRKDYIIAIGGGVVGDISGFAASVYMRGINFIQVPTTLLACCDSSVGGKTAINTTYGKNLVGTFYQPKAVIINTNFLKTLDEKQYKSGLGEIIKYGFIEHSCPIQNDYNLINFLNTNYEKIKSREALTLMELIKICIGLKISVVENDEKESGLRKILNFGHTYGHALEKYYNYRKYTHGHCVSAGIVFAMNLASKLNLIDKEYHFLAKDLISKYDFEKIPEVSINKLIPYMLSDKKTDSEGIKFILPTGYATVKEQVFTQERLKFYEIN